MNHFDVEIVFHTSFPFCRLLHLCHMCRFTGCVAPFFADSPWQNSGVCWLFAQYDRPWLYGLTILWHIMKLRLNHMVYNMVDHVFTAIFLTCLQILARLQFASCRAVLLIRLIPVAVRDWTSLFFMCKSVKEKSPSSPYGYSDWCEAFELVVNASISDCNASNVQWHRIVVGIPSTSIFTISVVDERLWYAPSLG